MSGSGRNRFLQIDERDNAIVALQDLPAGESCLIGDERVVIQEWIPAKHKFSAVDLAAHDAVIMYGVLVGRAIVPIKQGALLSTANIAHASSGFTLGTRNTFWQAPDVSEYRGRTFLGYHRNNGSVGTANYWLVVPLVFCENRNINVLKDALVDKLGYKRPGQYELKVDQLVDLVKSGKSKEEILFADLVADVSGSKGDRLFPNIDGVKFITHDMGCGGTREDSDALCGLLAGYITHPNVAGATVLSLGCQHSQISILQSEIFKRDGSFSKPLVLLEQQDLGTEKRLLEEALKQTIAGLAEANQNPRRPAPLSELCIGLECGGSDGFSGISANPALGYLSDMLVALGGSVILSEFPELCGVEQQLSDRCIDEATAERFMQLMRNYNARAEAFGSGFYANPSPGNIRDGLITDAIKSAGAAKKGGTSPVVDVLDYPEKVSKRGLNLLCTPGSDVESTTAEVGAGANVVLFTTGLGTPTGNPIAPVIKVSSNTAVYQKMPDIIDINCGTVIDGVQTIPEAARQMLDYVIQVASGQIEPKAVSLEQDDFIPWKRGVSL